MLDVFFTVDVEVWCGSWTGLDERFPRAFRQYIYGPTARGDYGLPYQIEVLRDHGLTGVFFVEPLFSTRFGVDPLAEIVALLQAGEQDVELHLHTEWVDESHQPLLDDTASKRQHLRYFSLDEQTILVAAGLRLMQEAGSGAISAFRAGSFGFNIDTLRALAANRVPFDSSYNASKFGLDSGVMPGTTLVDPVECEGVYEYPMTVFHDGMGLRHAQVTACSYKELESLLWKALAAERGAFVTLFHSFELLNQARDWPDDVVVRRFRKLCNFLDKNRDCFRMRGFQGLEPKLVEVQPAPLASPIWRTGARMVQQACRRKFG